MRSFFPFQASSSTDKLALLVFFSSSTLLVHPLPSIYCSHRVLAIAARLYTLSTRIAGFVSSSTSSLSSYVANVFSPFLPLLPSVPLRLRPVQVEGITDVDCTSLLNSGHLTLRDKIPEVLERVARRHEVSSTTAGEGDEEALEGTEEGVRRMSVVEERKTAGEHPEDEESRRKEGRKDGEGGEKA